MNPFFNANHSPIGAYASFTLGYPKASGGPSMETGPSCGYERIYRRFAQGRKRAYEGASVFRRRRRREHSIRCGWAGEGEQRIFRSDPPFQGEKDVRGGNGCFRSGGSDLFPVFPGHPRCRTPKRRTKSSFAMRWFPRCWRSWPWTTGDAGSSGWRFFGADQTENNCAVRHFAGEGLTGIGQGGKMGFLYRRRGRYGLRVCARLHPGGKRTRKTGSSTTERPGFYC